MLPCATHVAVPGAQAKKRRAEARRKFIVNEAGSFA
jgi:hypothetical protein